MSVFNSEMESGAVLVDYLRRIEELQTEFGALRLRKLRALAGSLMFLASGICMAVVALNSNMGLLPWLAVPLFGMLYSLRISMRSGTKAAESARRAGFYERGAERIEGEWRGTGNSSREFAREGHLYQWDLDILGEGSLFELLATTRSNVGAERLAEFLLEETSIGEARARQEAVKELRGATELREQVALLGKYRFQNCEGQHLRDWLSLPKMNVPSIVPVALLCSSSVSLVLGVCGLAKILSLAQIAPVLVLLLIVQAGVGLAQKNRVRLHLKELLTRVTDVAVLRQGVNLLARQQFQSTKLRGLVESVRKGNADACIRRLEWKLIAVERREDVILYAFGLWLAAGTQLVLAAERWRAENGREFVEWVNAWAEFEALNALGCYAHEHPENAFPELVDGAARFDAADLRHPLMVRERCVGNDVFLHRGAAFYVISGSNMAGKSTFLRAMGLNAVLAAAGAPVCAQQASISVFNICACIAVGDSLADGKSKFLAEVERLKSAIAATEKDAPVLFLIDEILSGTNSADRRVAAEAVIAALVAGWAVGALSTHDLALTEIAADAALRGVNVHMQSENSDQPLVFDYRVKPGGLRKTNALVIVRMLGIPM